MKGLMDDVYINGVRVASWDIFSLGNICDHFVFLEKTKPSLLFIIILLANFAKVHFTRNT